MEKTIPTRINSVQHKIIRDASVKMDVTYQYLLRRVLRVGINVMRLKDKK